MSKFYAVLILDDFHRWNITEIYTRVGESYDGPDLTCSNTVAYIGNVIGNSDVS